MYLNLIFCMVVGYPIIYTRFFFQYFLKLVNIFLFFIWAGALKLGSQRHFSTLFPLLFSPAKRIGGLFYKALGLSKAPHESLVTHLIWNKISPFNGEVYFLSFIFLVFGTGRDSSDDIHMDFNLTEIIWQKLWCNLEGCHIRVTEDPQWYYASLVHTSPVLISTA